MLRMQGEAEAARRRVLLEQAFSPAVARELESNPDILQAQHREVTVLFADLRGFTSIFRENRCAPDISTVDGNDGSLLRDYRSTRWGHY